MFTSIKSKILCMIIVMFALTAALIIFFTTNDVGTAMVEAETRSARNIMVLVDTTISSNYRNLLYTKVRSVMTRKKRLGDAMDVAMTGVHGFYQLAQDGIISDGEARKRALDMIRNLQYGDGEYFFVFDQNATALAYPEADMEGRPLSQFMDIKSRAVTTAMWQETLDYGSAYDVFRWKDLGSWDLIPRIGYFVRFAPWDWVVATGMDISDLEREETMRRNNLVEVLRSTLSDLRIARSGLVMLFNGDNELLIPAPGVGGHALSRAALSDPTLLDKLKMAAHEGTVLRRDQATDKGFEVRPMEFTVSHFKALDWYFATAVFTDELKEPADRLVTREIIIISAISFLGILLGLAVTSRISRPLLRLADYSRGLAAREDFTRPSDETIPIRAMARSQSDETGRLAKALVFMEDELRANVLSLLESRAKEERLQNELAMAARIQQDMLPPPLPISQVLNSLELHAELRAAKEVGGDLYQYFLSDGDKLVFAVGDVADKGMPSALFMAMTTTLINSEAKGRTDPGQILKRINRNLCQGNRNNMFVTLVLGLLHLSTGELRFASGGHNPLLLARANKQIGYLPITEDPMLGLLPDASFKTVKLRLAPGDLLTAYSDGVTDAMNPEKEPFGEERLRRVVAKNRDHTPEMLGKIILASIRGYCRQEPQFDDVTLLMLRYKG